MELRETGGASQLAVGSKKKPSTSVSETKRVVEKAIATTRSPHDQSLATIGEVLLGCHCQGGDRLSSQDVDSGGGRVGDGFAKKRTASFCDGQDSGDEESTLNLFGGGRGWNR